ncbi:uncharacterized protein A1O5_09354 [Cladophialophora psammophila CBS 110553]|uniref:Uncharacterized protein n=1 Tax=Cladophialophora psammophila CBS 110553 TaxID=1182543 RepID=W9WRT1_9EURO|nr:uncharacterized protein A1O5_09354 [Cladophialophora psammophila CBS 110553]EXJ67341.1 hypothetical protein A1O5_09354 [Cladophialophora psammophila CBS 110553]
MSKRVGKHVLRAILRKISVPLRRCLRRKKASTSPERTVDLAQAGEVFTQDNTVATQDDNVSTETQAPQPPEHLLEVHRVALGNVKKHEVTVLEADYFPEQHGVIFGDPEANAIDVQIPDGVTVGTGSSITEAENERTPVEIAEGDQSVQTTAGSNMPVEGAQDSPQQQVAVDDNLNGPGASIREDSPLGQQHAPVKQRQKHVRFDSRRNQIFVFESQKSIVEELNRQLPVQAPSLSQHVPTGRRVEGCNPSFSRVDAQQRMLFLMYGVQTRQDDTYRPYFDRQFDMIFGGQRDQEDMNRPYTDTGRQWPSFDERTRRCRLWDDSAPVHIEFNQVLTPKAPKKPTKGLSTARQLGLSGIFDQAIECESLVEQASMHLACVCQIQRWPNAHRAYRYGLDDAACRLPFIVMEYYFSGFTYTGSLELVLGICPVSHNRAAMRYESSIRLHTAGHFVVRKAEVGAGSSVTRGCRAIQIPYSNCARRAEPKGKPKQDVVGEAAAVQPGLLDRHNQSVLCTGRSSPREQVVRRTALEGIMGKGERGAVHRHVGRRGSPV